MSRADVLPATVTYSTPAQLVKPPVLEVKSIVLPARVSVEGTQTIAPFYPGSGSES
jgi:hypothetical protein